MSTSDFIGDLPSASKRTFSVTRKIRFGQTDPAAIVYYPNYFDMFNEIVEDWFEEDLGVPFDQLHRVDGLGVPIVHIECDFIAPCRLGEQFTLSLSVVNLGPTSLHLEIAGKVSGDMRIKASLVLVFVDLTTYRSVEPPDSLRALIAERVIGGAKKS
jgi:4-hydroxybenzoyl-CoA thioesterase